MTSTPSAVSTRAISSIIRGWSARGRCSIVSNDTTASTLPSGSGSDAALPASKRTLASAAYTARACATAPASMSMPVTALATPASSALP